LAVEAVIGFRDAGKTQRPDAAHSLYSMEEMNAESLTDVALMAAVVRRDADAMAAIYERYESLLRSVISSILHEGGETDDVLHEVFMQLWNRADRFLAEKGLQGFLVTMAKRRALDRLAYRRPTHRLEIQMVAEFNDKIGRPQVRPTTFDLSELLSTMIRLLPEPQQEVVELTFFKGLTQREIAAKKSMGWAQ
jgi:RNA polymerase sigma-70 factor, ECF subfamily